MRLFSRSLTCVPSAIAVAAAAPVTGQREAGVLVDHVDHCRLEFVGVDVLRVDPAQRLSRCDLGGVSSSLIGAEIAAVAEHRENISLNSVGKLRICAGWWSEVADVASPVLGMLENVKEMPLRHPRTDFLLEFGQPFRLDGRRQLLQVGCSVLIDAQFTVGRKSCVNLGSEARQFGLECGSKIHAALGNAESRAVSCEAWFAFRPRQELGALTRTPRLAVMPFSKAMSAGRHLYFARRVTFLSCADSRGTAPHWRWAVRQVLARNLHCSL